jgi:hypothetical protein
MQTQFHIILIKYILINIHGFAKSNFQEKEIALREKVSENCEAENTSKLRQNCD